MSPPELIIAMNNLGVRVTASDDVLHVDTPKGALTPPIFAALKEHKPLLIAVFVTLHDRSRDDDWDLLRSWLIDDHATTFTPAVLAAARRIRLPVGEDIWPEAYARSFRTALRVRALLAVLGDDPVPIGRRAAIRETTPSMTRRPEKGHIPMTANGGNA